MKLGKVIEDIFAAEESLRKCISCFAKYRDLTFSEKEAMELAERSIERLQASRTSVRKQLEQQEKRSCTKQSNSSQL